MLPVVFVSHGSPRLALEGGGWAQALRGLGNSLLEKKPKLVLVLSAHWLTKGLRVECSFKHKTIHDFSGFDRKLYELTYPAVGNPVLCKEIAESVGAKCTEGRGLDHGAWAPLWHIFPQAGLPVSQLSIDTSRTLQEHLSLAESLRSFRDRVLLLCSGGAVHNLRDAILNPKRPPEWAVNFNKELKELLLNKDIGAFLELINSDLGKQAHPTQEHVIPLIYFLGLLEESEEVSVLYDGFEFGSVSLLSFKSVI